MGARPGRHLQPLQSHPVQLVTRNCPGRVDRRGRSAIAVEPAAAGGHATPLGWHNSSVDERNLSAALGAGVTPTTVDHDHIKRVRDWIWTLPPPKYPYAIDATLWDSGQAIYARLCAECHSFGGTRTGTVVDIGDIGTASASQLLHPHLRGKSSPALPGVQVSVYAFPQDASATPIIHWMAFGLVRLTSTMARCQRSGMLQSPAARPRQFSRGYDVYDKEKVGFISDTPEANAPARRTIPPSPAME